MRARFIFLMLFICKNADASTPLFAEIQFKDGPISYTVHMDQKRLDYTDQIETRTLILEACNRALAQRYWNDLLTAISSLRTARQETSLQSSPLLWLKFGGGRYKVFRDEPARAKLDLIPQSIHVLFAEGRRACVSSR